MVGPAKDMLQVDLIDATADAFEMVLSYIYTDRIHPVQKVGQEPHSNGVILLMMDVYRLALQVSLSPQFVSYYVPEELLQCSLGLLNGDIDANASQ